MVYLKKKKNQKTITETKAKTLYIFSSSFWQCAPQLRKEEKL